VEVSMAGKSFRQIAESMTSAELARALDSSVSAAAMVRAGRRSLTLRRLRTFVEVVGRDRVDLHLTLIEEAARADIITATRRG
jgi:hypothetical protein